MEVTIIGQLILRTPCNNILGSNKWTDMCLLELRGWVVIFYDACQAWSHHIVRRRRPDLRPQWSDMRHHFVFSGVVGTLILTNTFLSPTTNTDPWEKLGEDSTVSKSVLENYFQLSDKRYLKLVFYFILHMMQNVLFIPAGCI